MPKHSPKTYVTTRKVYKGKLIVKKRTIRILRKETKRQ